MWYHGIDNVRMNESQPHTHDVDVDDPCQNEFVQSWLEAYREKYGPQRVRRTYADQTVEIFNHVIEAIQETYKP